MASIVSRLTVAAWFCCASMSCTTLQSSRATYHQTTSRQEAQEANERGLAHVENSEWDKAEKAFQEALQSDREYAAAHNNLGLVLMRKGRYYEAAHRFQCASDLSPSANEPKRNLENLKVRLGLAQEPNLGTKHSSQE